MAAAKCQDFGHVPYLLPHSFGLLDLPCIVKPQAAALRYLVSDLLALGSSWEAIHRMC